MRRIFLLFVCAALTAAAVDESAEAVSLGAYSAQARAALEDRIRQTLRARQEPGSVRGTVTCSRDDYFFVQGREEALKVFVEKGALPQAGDVVEAKGHPALEGGRVVLVAESWKKTGSAPLPTPRAVTASDLLYVGTGTRAARQDINWLLVEVRGRAVAKTESGFAIDVEGLPVTVALDEVPRFVDDCEKTHPLVTARGVAELFVDQSVLFGRSRQVLGVKIDVSSVADVTLEPDAVYLLNRRDRRVMTLVAVLIGVLALGLVALVAFSVRQARRQLRSRTLMNERKRMADDLHDTIEQHLVGAGMLLQLQKTAEAREILLQAKREMRDIVWGLKNDDMMRLTPAEMIRQFAREETRKGLYRVTARVPDLPHRLEAGEMRDLSLIVREAIGNAVKHGGARKIALSSDPLPNGGWMLRVANDGKPFEPEKAPGVAEGHFGVEGMRQRARRLGADLSFQQKGEWTVLMLRKLSVVLGLLVAVAGM